jgi:hypothetical protein
VADTLLNSPQTAVRTFGLLIPAIAEGNPEHAAAALHYATVLARDLQRWDVYPYSGTDAAIMRLAKLFRRRTASTSALTPWDTKALMNAYLEALHIGTDIPSGPNNISVRLFDTACDLLETAWREDGHI